MLAPAHSTARTTPDAPGEVGERTAPADESRAPGGCLRESSDRKTTRRELAAILLIGAVVRGALVWQFGATPPLIGDAADYNRLAKALVEHGSYLDEYGNLTSLRPPLFPWAVAQIYKVFGTESFLAVSTFHGILSLLTVVLAFWLATDVYSRRVGVWAAGLTCFYPSLLAYNQFLLGETLFTFLVAAGALCSVRALKTGGLPAAILLGLTLGLGALTRSVLWLFAPLLCAGLAIFSNCSRGRRLAVGAATLAAFAATIGPWAWRNSVVQRTLTFIDVMGGRNVMMGNYEYTPLDRSWATIETETGDRAWHRVLASHTEGYASLTQGQIDKRAMSYGVKYFFTHPGQSLARSTVKFFNYWQLEREVVAGLWQGAFGGASKVLVVAVAGVVCGYYVVSVFAAIFGAILTPPAGRAIHWLLLGWIAFPCALHAIAFAHSRYHLPFMPIVLVFAAAAIVYRTAIWEQRGSWRFAAACACCALLAASWVREFIVLDLKWFV
jgi:4-amino-4-deoxy-L-arabinose transferase-like glycosyltransferase